MKLKILSLIMLFWSIFGIITSSYFIYVLWFLSYEIATRNTINFIGGLTLTLLLITLIIVLIISIAEIWGEIKKWKKSGN